MTKKCKISGCDKLVFAIGPVYEDEVLIQDSWSCDYCYKHYYLSVKPLKRKEATPQ